jgi:hypothetical protein
METKTSALTLATLAAMLMTLTGCEAVKGIFKAGMWTGVILVAVIAGILFAVVGKSRAA